MESLVYSSLIYVAKQLCACQWSGHPPPPMEEGSRFDGKYLPLVGAVKHPLPLFPDFVDKLKTTLVQPHLAKLMLHGYSHFFDFEGAGIILMPPVDGKLADDLGLLANKGMANSNPSLPNKHSFFWGVA